MHQCLKWPLVLHIFVSPLCNHPHVFVKMWIVALDLAHSNMPFLPSNTWVFQGKALELSPLFYSVSCVILSFKKIPQVVVFAKIPIHTKCQLSLVDNGFFFDPITSTTIQDVGANRVHPKLKCKFVFPLAFFCNVKGPS